MLTWKSTHLVINFTTFNLENTLIILAVLLSSFCFSSLIQAVVESDLFPTAVFYHEVQWETASTLGKVQLILLWWQDKGLVVKRLFVFVISFPAQINITYIRLYFFLFLYTLLWITTLFYNDFRYVKSLKNKRFYNIKIWVLHVIYFT